MSCTEIKPSLNQQDPSANLLLYQKKVIAEFSLTSAFDHKTFIHNIIMQIFHRYLKFIFLNLKLFILLIWPSPANLIYLKFFPALFILVNNMKTYTFSQVWTCFFFPFIDFQYAFLPILIILHLLILKTHCFLCSHWKFHSSFLIISCLNYFFN